MSVEAEAAERVLRMEIMLTESAVKLAATGAVNLAMLLIAAVRNEVHMGGRTNVAKMLEQGKQITAFPINTDSLTKFAELAKKHKLACGYILTRRTQRLQMLSSRPKMQSLQIRFARTQVSRFCRVSTKKNRTPVRSPACRRNPKIQWRANWHQQRLRR